MVSKRNVFVDCTFLIRLATVLCRLKNGGIRMDSVELTAALREESRRLGFDLVGACPAVTPPGIERFRGWIAAGRAGQMRYLEDRAEAYAHPRHVLPEVQSLLMLGMSYRTATPVPPRPGEGAVSRYAWGADYHDLIHDRLKRLADFLRRRSPEAAVRGVVDTAPLLERDFAQLAGLGWIGKNTLLLNRRLGSWFFLAALLTSEVLEYDEPVRGHCGTCRACIEACPTGALIEPGVLDARRCLSYLSIELRGPAPSEFRLASDGWLLGCDRCQEVCPWNRHVEPVPAASLKEFEPRSGMNPVELAELFFLDEAVFRERFRGTPLWRAKRRGVLRNAAILLGARMHPPALPALIHGLADVEPQVRAACAWALGRHSEPAVGEALRQRLSLELDADVRRRIREALDARNDS